MTYSSPNLAQFKPTQPRELSVKYCLAVPVFHFWPKLAPCSAVSLLSAIAELLVYVSIRVTTVFRAAVWLGYIVSCFVGE